MSGIDAMRFESFSKIPRLFRQMVVTEKIDGTNAQIIVPENPGDPVIAGSRKRLLLPGQIDNFGFRAWVEEHEDELRQLGPGRHFGEWWGQGIQRKYGLNEKRFSLFNVFRWRSNWSGIPEPGLHDYSVWEGDPEKVCFAPTCCHVVPVIYAGPFDLARIRALLLCLRSTHSVAAPDFTNPEGLVVHHNAAKQLFKVTIENDDTPKGQDPK